MGKRFYMLIAISLLILLGIGSASAITATNPWVWLGVEQAKMAASDDKDYVVAYVNGEPVTKGEITSWQNVIKWGNRISGSNQPNSVHDAFDDLIKSKSIIAIAKKEGLWPTDEETREHIKGVRESFELIGGEAKEELEYYLDGLGLTEDEFFEEYSFEDYRRSLAVGRYWEKMCAEYADEQPDKQIELVDRQVRNMMDNAKVEIVDPMLRKR